jgi:hypothetical protein
MTEHNSTSVSNKDGDSVPEISRTEIQRYQTFIWIQLFFLAVSVFAGDFNFTVWSMLDSSILDMAVNVLVSGSVGWRNF